MFSPHEDALPITPFDTDEIKAARRVLQKRYADEALDAWLLHRRVSIFFSLPIAKKTTLHPNIITLLAVLISIIGIYVLWFDAYPAIVGYAFLLYHIAYFLDVVDGEVARARQQRTKLGQWLDRILSYSMDGLSLATAVVVAGRLSEPFLASAAVVAFFIRLGTRCGYAELKPEAETASHVQAPAISNVLVNILRMLSAPSGLMLFGMLAAYLRAPIYLSIGIALLTLSTVYIALVHSRLIDR